MSQSRRGFAALIILFAVSLGMRQLPARAAQGPNADQKDLSGYVLTADKMQKLVRAIADLNMLSKRHPELKLDPGGQTIDQMVRKIQRFPDAVSALSKTGITPREYVIGSFTLLQASMAVGFKKAGVIKEYPAETLKNVHPATLAFVESHYDEISQSLSALSTGEDDSDDDTDDDGTGDNEP